ncbi:MAG: rubredoxin [Ramlibacter sp.]|nr:rubredoxin [Ramlibacter sp.]
MKIMECLTCGFIYDEAVGLPEHGIVAGTPWEDLPEKWKCPECAVGKQGFEEVHL